MSNILMITGLLVSFGVFTVSHFIRKASAKAVGKIEFWKASLKVGFFTFMSMLLISSGAYIEGIHRAKATGLDTSLNRFWVFGGCPGLIAFVSWTVFAITVWRLQESRVE